MNKKIIIIVASIVIGCGAVVYALLYTPPENTASNQEVDTAELAKHDGLGSNTCWVAVDGVVYSISGFSEWSMGKHLPSNDKATCGRDLSGVIGESPHGKSVLQLLKVVGNLKSQ